MARDEKMKQVLENLEKGVKDFFTSDKYQEYLGVMNRFHHYSINNQILIAMQRPDVTLVAGYNSWIKNFERHVVTGEKGITILAPMKRLVEVETERADENGNAIVEQVEQISFRPVTVFDVSQTDGKELPTPINNLEGTVDRFNDFMSSLRVASPFPFNIMAVESRANGWCDHVSETIVIKAGMSELQTIKTAIHEVAHGRVHEQRNKSREQMEVEAESIAYVVCQHYGLDTSEYSFGYVASWANAQEDNDILKNCLETIRTEANAIIDIVDRELDARSNQIEGIMPTEIEKHTEAIMKDALMELGADSQFIKARVYGHEKTGRERTCVKVLAEYTGPEREDSIFNVLHEEPVRMGSLELDINPIKDEKSGDLESYYHQVRTFEREEMTDDTWPMITVTYSTYEKIRPTKYNIYEAKKLIEAAESKFSKDSIKGNFLRINVAYTYEGHKYEQTDVVLMGEGRRNFIDYLSLPKQVTTYMHRHVQLLETVERAKGVDAISPGTKAQEMYEDMMHEWAEKQRLELNYNIEPDVKKPPEWNKDIEEKHKGWEMIR